MTFQLSGEPSSEWPTEKLCCIYKKVKPASEFTRARSRKGTPTLSSRCKECNAEYMKCHYSNHKDSYDAYRRKNQQIINEAKRKRYREDEEYRQDIIAKTKDYHRRNPDTKRSNNLLVNYGLTLESYEAILDLQGGGCAICGRTKNSHESHKYLHVDHDHTTGEVRGILCNRCNAALGLFADDVSKLRRAIDYLEGTLHEPPYGIIYDDDEPAPLL